MPSGCEHLSTCSFFDEVLGDMPQMADHLMRKYCLQDSERCARSRLARFLGPDNVPSELFPNDQSKADRILSAAL